jgi:AcrR family transcriptional regulator
VSSPAPDSPFSRRGRKKERTRREIYDAAMKLFAARGYSNVTIDEICEQADVGRSTFFLHFPAKSALMMEFNYQVAADFADRLAHGRRGSAREELTALIDDISARIAAQPGVMLGMVREFFATPEAVVQAHQEGGGLQPLIESLVRRGQERGEFTSRVHPRLAAVSLLVTAGSILNGRVFEDREIPEAEVRRQMLALTFGGLGVRSGTA